MTAARAGWLAGLAMMFLALAGWALDVPYVLALPAAALLFWWAFARTDLYLSAVLFLVPLSLNLSEFGLVSMGWYMPTEPMLFALLLVVLARACSGQIPDRAFLQHPATLVLGAGFLWMGLTILPSSHMVVSLKAWVARAWFLASFYVMLAAWFQADPKAKTRFLALLLLPLSVVIAYTLVRHAGYGFSKGAGHWVMKPFFKDHTSYGAVLAMMLPPTIALAWRANQSTLSRVLWWLGAAWLTVGTVLSFTRAAWVSLAAAGAIWALMFLGVKLKTLFATGVVGLVALALSWDALVIQLERNKQDSSDDLAQHVESISNVSSDDSNLERLNRWSCAVAMFEERPAFGFGPGTYQFEYAPFQTSNLRTQISTNNADLGNAHSEYLGPLAEQGILGLMSVLGLLLVTAHLGFKLQRTLVHPDDRRLALGVFLGLVTYFVHGGLNNYLDTDKASAPFWGFLAMLVVFDLGTKAANSKGEVTA
jgi:putative inorganic carbon (hco3(-)) transporter